MHTNFRKVSFYTLLFLLGTVFVSAQYPITHANCGANATLKASDFKVNYLFTHTGRNDDDMKNTLKDTSAQNLIRFDLLKNGDDFDVYYGGFEGILYRYDSQNKKITKIKDFETIQGSVGTTGRKDKKYGGGDHGVTGIAFHPNFEMNRWLFVFYTPKVAKNQNRVMLLSRFEMTPQYTLVNEKVLLTMEATTSDRWHSGGDMYFNAQGDLFLQVGDNVGSDKVVNNKVENAAWTSANTTNLIGGVVRIHPDNSVAGYAIPKGNFGEYFAPFDTQQDYLDTSRVKPEIFAKGQRSNFSSTGHPVELIHIWGEVCTGGNHDEVNIINKPIYGGWPHYQGNARSSRTGGSNNRYKHKLDQIPTLGDSVAGDLVGPKAIQNLPKVYPADMVMDKEFNVVMAQALYYYGRGDSIWSNRTFPPQLHETFIFSRLNGSNARIVPLIKNGGNVTAEKKDATYGVKGLLTDNTKIFNAMTEAKYGPDGALYVLARGGGYGLPKAILSRIDYVGGCQDQALFDKNQAAFKVAKGTSNQSSRLRAGFYEPPLYSNVSAFDRGVPLYLKAGTALNVEVYNVQGKLIGKSSASVNKSGKVSYWNGALEASKKAQEGIYFLQYRNLQGKLLFSRKQVL